MVHNKNRKKLGFYSTFVSGILSGAITYWLIRTIAVPQVDGQEIHTKLILTITSVGSLAIWALILWAGYYVYKPLSYILDKIARKLRPLDMKVFLDKEELKNWHFGYLVGFPITIVVTILTDFADQLHGFSWEVFIVLMLVLLFIILSPIFAKIKYPKE